MRREADLTAWGKLYETAGKIKALEPWKDFWDMDLIIVCPKGKKVPYFCSIMGHGGVCCGISVYKMCIRDRYYLLAFSANSVVTRSL